MPAALKLLRTVCRMWWNCISHRLKKSRSMSGKVDQARGESRKEFCMERR